MRALVIAFAILVSQTVFAQARPYTCTPDKPEATIATKHLASFDVEAGRDAITLSAFKFMTQEPGVAGAGCGQNPPSSPVSIEEKVPNAAKTEPLKSMSEFKAESSSPMITDTCFFSLALYLPKGAAAGAEFTLHAVWSDTDGEHSPGAGGDTYTCRR